MTRLGLLMDAMEVVPHHDGENVLQLNLRLHHRQKEQVEDHS